MKPPTVWTVWAIISSSRPPGPRFGSGTPFATGERSAMSERHALVVENDLDQRRRVVVQLKHWGYTPVAVTSAEEALETVGRLNFALSVIAIRLPGMSGIDLLRRAQALAEAGPVIMIADSDHSPQIVEAIQAGADDFLRRPYTAEDLEHAIKGSAGRPNRAAPAAGTLEAVDENGARLERELALLV